MIWSIAEATGWKWQYILWGITWLNIRMMLADAPRYDFESKGEGKASRKNMSDEDWLDAFAG